jgi:hypothetical protein
MKVVLPNVIGSQVPHPNLEVYIDGVGIQAEAGGAAIYLEHYEGKWQLLVWSDINEADPTHIIDMSNAMESQLETPTCRIK